MNALNLANTARPQFLACVQTVARTCILQHVLLCDGPGDGTREVDLHLVRVGGEEVPLPLEPLTQVEVEVVVPLPSHDVERAARLAVRVRVRHCRLQNDDRHKCVKLWSAVLQAGCEVCVVFSFPLDLAFALRHNELFSNQTAGAARLNFSPDLHINASLASAHLEVVEGELDLLSLG